MQDKMTHVTSFKLDDKTLEKLEEIVDYHQDRIEALGLYVRVSKGVILREMIEKEYKNVIGK